MRINESTRGCILVVDDDADIRELLTELLNDQGYSVESAANGHEALAKLRALSGRVRLILLDLMMPVMNGWEVAEILKKDPEHSRIPFVVVSADRDISQHADTLGAMSYLQKPVELKAILALARTAFPQ